MVTHEARRAKNGANCEGFTCCWCGMFRPWRVLGAWNQRMKWCDDCVTEFEQILTVWR